MIAFIVQHLDGQNRAYDQAGNNVTPAGVKGLDDLRRLAPGVDVVVMRPPEAHTWAVHDDAERYAK